jgi:hypothetical protein
VGIDTFSSADDFIATLTGFAQMLTRVDLLQEFYTDDAAALLYDCVTNSAAGTIRTAEFFRAAPRQDRQHSPRIRCHRAATGYEPVTTAPRR